MKTTTLFLLLMNLTLLVNAQEFTVPENYKFETVEDIKSYESDIKACINWLESSPLNEQPSKRKEANAFLLSWLSVSPSVKIGVQPYLTELTGKNPDLLMIFFGGWTSYSLENPDQIKNAEINNLKGMESLLAFYSKNLDAGIKNDKKIEKLRKMTSAKLEEWVKSQL